MQRVHSCLDGQQIKVRNFQIRCLRGMWTQTSLLLPHDVETARFAIDAALEALGAEPESVRLARYHDHNYAAHPTKTLAEADAEARTKYFERWVAEGRDEQFARNWLR